MIFFASRRLQQQHRQGLQADLPRIPRREIPTISLDQLRLAEEESDSRGGCIIVSTNRRRGSDPSYDDTLEDRFDDATAAPPEEYQPFHWS